MVMCDMVILNFEQYLREIEQLLDSYTGSTIYGILHRYNRVVLSCVLCKILAMTVIVEFQY